MYPVLCFPYLDPSLCGNDGVYGHVFTVSSSEPETLFAFICGLIFIRVYLRLIALS